MSRIQSRLSLQVLMFFRKIIPSSVKKSIYTHNKNDLSILLIINVNINNTAIEQGIFETLPLLYFKAHLDLSAFEVIGEEILI